MAASQPTSPPVAAAPNRRPQDDECSQCCGLAPLVANNDLICYCFA
jgi:hypothetical protein